MDDIKDFTAILNRLTATYKILPGVAATVAVTFFKERFIEQAWLDKTKTKWKSRKQKDRKRPGRAIGTDTARLRRDIQKLSVGPDYAVVGTTRLTSKYAKAFNEGFKGEVTVKPHDRKRYKMVKEKYKTKSGRTRSRKSKQIDKEAGVIKVSQHRRKMNQPARQFLGSSMVLDRRMELALTARIIKAIKG